MIWTNMVWLSNRMIISVLLTMLRQKVSSQIITIHRPLYNHVSSSCVGSLTLRAGEAEGGDIMLSFIMLYMHIEIHHIASKKTIEGDTGDCCEILHQLVDRASLSNHVTFSVSQLPIVANWCKISKPSRVCFHHHLPIGDPHGRRASWMGSYSC